MRRKLKALATSIFLALAWIGAVSAAEVDNYWFNGTLGTSCPSCWIPASPANPFPTYTVPYGAGQTAITGNATGTTGAVVGTLAGVASKTTYICGFNVSAVGTLAVGPITIAGLITASMVYQLTATASGSSVTQTFTPCIPASAVNTAITITTTADGSASAVDVNSWGYQQ